MAEKKSKTNADQDNKVHVDFVGECAFFIRKFAFDTGKSNNDAAHILMRLIQSAEETTTITVQDVEFPVVDNKHPRIFKRKAIKQIKVRL
jgi:hypothetical protein